MYLHDPLGKPIMIDKCNRQHNMTGFVHQQHLMVSSLGDTDMVAGCSIGIKGLSAKNDFISAVVWQTVGPKSVRGMKLTICRYWLRDTFAGPCKPSQPTQDEPRAT